MADKKRRLVKGRDGANMYVIEGGERRWVPDLWTLRDTGLTPTDLEVLTDAQLKRLPLGDALPSTVPSPALEVGSYVETEYGVFRVQKSGLRKVNPHRAAVEDPDLQDSKKARNRVVFLPASLVRAMARVDSDGKA